MNGVQCKNNHWFDCDEYEKCPFCGEDIKTNSDIKLESSDGKGIKGIIASFKSKHSHNIDSTNEEPVKSDVVHKSKETSQEIFSNSDFDDITQGKYDEPFNNIPPFEINIACETFGKFNEEIDNSKKNKANDKHLITDDTCFENNSSSPQNINVIPLSETIKNVSANAEGKTTGYFSAMKTSKESNKSECITNEPVVGWLICISGNHLGESFCIYSGKNSLGRNESNKIILNKDKTISGNKHALIMYEPKKRKFYIQPGDSSGLTYLNDDDVFETKPIKEKDVIEIGKTKLMFIPLCGEAFSWENYFTEG